MEGYFTNERTDVLDMIPEGRYAKALEIGGGEFPTLRRFCASRETEGWGVDIHPAATTDIKFIRGSIEDDQLLALLPDNGFDLIIANDVIEHLIDTEKFLAAVKSKLTPDGVFMLSVPNIRQVRSFYHIHMRGRFPRDAAGLFDRTHMRWFCKHDIIALGSNASLETIVAKSVGRLVPSFLAKTIIGELLGLQNIFLMKPKKSD
jgi:SAM-dependent methyltransferase